MNSHLRHLFEIQTDILLNYVLSKLIKFFILPMQNEVHLFDTISPARELTRHELSETGREVPTTLKYEIYAKKCDSKLIILLRADNLADIEMYNAILYNEHPSISFLKNIVQIIMHKYRPIPTKVNRQFSSISQKYSEYLKFYEVKRSWQNGYISIKKAYSKDVKKESELINSVYPEFVDDVLKLRKTYRAFTKILIDIYQNKPTTEYSDKDRINTIIAAYTYNHCISIVINNSSEQTSFNYLITLDDFDPNSSFFAEHHHVCKTITKCVSYTLNPKK